MRTRIILAGIVVTAVLVVAFFAVKWLVSEFGDDTVATEPASTPLSSELKTQLEEDVELMDLIKEGYQPTTVITHKEDDPKIQLVHCDPTCNDAPYSREYPAVQLSVKQLPAVGQIESIDIVKVTIVMPRHLDTRKQYGEVTSCSESLFYSLTLTDLRAVIDQLEGEDSSILPGDRLTAADGVESWKC